MSDNDKVKKKTKGPVRRFISLTLGPKAFVAQSFGTDVGSTLKEQYKEWKQVNDVDLKQVVAHRKDFDFESRCFGNKRKPGYVRKAYRNVAIIQGFLWFGISLTLATALAGTSSLMAGLFNTMALIALPTMLLATAHHQVCIKEKRFLSPGELLKLVARRPDWLIPSPLPPEWKLYTKVPEPERRKYRPPKKRVTVKKRG